MVLHAETSGSLGHFSKVPKFKNTSFKGAVESNDLNKNQTSGFVSKSIDNNKLNLFA